jgi:hypothetical protein
VIEFHDDHHRTLTGHVLAAEGNWQRFMTARHARG